MLKNNDKNYVNGRSMLRLVRGKLPRNCRENLYDFPCNYLRFIFVEGWAEAQPCVGGDPSAGSPTDTLLRLNLPC